MKSFRNISKVFGVMVLATAPMLIVDSYQAHRCSQEAQRMTAVDTVLAGKLEEYQRANGHYPEAVDTLSFTNSPEEIEMLPDIRRIHYRRTQSGYALSYDGVYGYHFSEVSASH